MKKSQILKISDIEVDEKYYIRAELNEKVAKEYARLMDEGVVFPNIEVALFRKRYILVDGRHRLEAQKVRGERFIQADVRDNFTDMSEIFVASVRANERHGLRLNRSDKLRIAYTMESLDFDVENITKLTGISAKELEREVLPKIRRVKVIQNIQEGKSPPVIKDVRKEGERRGDIFDGKKEAMVREEHKAEWQLSELNDVYNYLKTEKFDMGNKKICNAISKIKKLLKKRFPKG